MSIDWDAYRRDYDTLTDAQHRELYERVWELYPNQRGATVPLVKRFLAEHVGRVVEIGSWDGWLWEQAGGGRTWSMVELCAPAAAVALSADREGVNDGEMRIPTAFRWWRTWEPVAGDLLIASHMIEHLSDADFTELVKAVFLRFEAVYLEAPLPQKGPCNWVGYQGSHVMTMGWDGVRDIMSDLGFVEQWAERDSVVWGKA